MATLPMRLCVCVCSPVFVFLPVDVKPTARGKATTEKEKSPTDERKRSQNRSCVRSLLVRFVIFGPNRECSLYFSLARFDSITCARTNDRFQRIEATNSSEE